MWLKTLTIALVLFGLGLLLTKDFILGPVPPKSEPREVKIDYLRKSAVFVGAEAGALIGAFVCAYLVARRARQEYREQSKKNFEALLESTLKDHGKSPEE